MGQWVLFAAAMVALAAILYIPGYFFCRGMRFSRLVSVICAPVISAACLAILPIVFGKVGIACNGFLVVGATLAICLAVFGISHFLGVRSARAKGGDPSARGRFRCRGCVLDVSGRSTIAIGKKTVSFERLALLAYVAFGMLVCAYMLISNLGTADAFYCRWDNQTHISALRSFMETGVWSSLSVDAYATALPNANPYGGQGGFYPAAWHDTVVAASSLTGIDPLISANALNALLIGIIYPTSMFLMMKALFPNSRRIVAAGSVVCMSFSAFPWAYFLYGPYVANLFGQSMLPSVMAVFMMYFTYRLVRRKPVAFVVFGVIAFVGLALGHPNTLFTALLYLGVFMCSFVYHAVGKSGRTLFGHKRLAQVAALLGVLAVVVIIWTICFNLPALHNVVFFGRAVNSSVGHALATVATMALSIARHPMYALAVITLVGLIVCLKKKLWWLLVPVVLMGLAYLATRTSDSILKNILGGFWYVDVRRITANMCMFLVPVVSVGADAAVRWVARVVERLSHRGHKPARDCVVATVLVVVFVVVNFTPWIPVFWGDGKVNTGIGSIRGELYSMFSPDVEQIYSHVERDFVDEVAETVPEGALVLNMPHDGSVFAYGANGLNTYYRTCRAGGMTEDGEIIRTRLVDYASDPKVRDAVSHTGAQYLLQLDQGGTLKDRPWLVQYVNANYKTGPEHWEGINAIRDDTPGFTVVLSEGDMRLFRIDPIGQE